MIKTKFRIYTEYVHTRHVAEIVSKYFADYSMFSGIDYNNGNNNRCLVIEIISHDIESENIMKVCQEINSDNHQDYCVVTSEQVFVMNF